MKIIRVIGHPTTTVFNQIKKTQPNPDLQQLEFKQGRLGDCALLSALYVIANNKIGSKCLALVTKNANHNELNFGNYKKIFIDSTSFENKQVTSKTTAQEYLLRQIEIGYDHLEAQKTNELLGPDHYYSKHRKIFDEFNNGVDFVEVCKDIIGKFGIGKGFRIKKSPQLMNEILNKAETKPNKYIIGASAKNNTQRQFKEFEANVSQDELEILKAKEKDGSFKIITGIPTSSKTYFIKLRIDLPQMSTDGFYCNHSYAIKAINGNNVTLINPHDTSKPIVITRNKFFANFDKIEGYEISSPKLSRDITTYVDKNRVMLQIKAFMKKIDACDTITQKDIDHFFSNYKIMTDNYLGTVSLENFKKLATIFESVSNDKNVKKLITIADGTFTENEKQQSEVCQILFSIISNNPTKHNISAFKSMLNGENLSYYPDIISKFKQKTLSLQKN